MRFGRRHSYRRLLGPLCILVIGLTILGSPARPNASPIGSRAGHGTPLPSGARLAGTGITLREEAVDPTSLVLSWSPSGDPLLVGYALEYSPQGSSGPWTTIATVISRSTTSELVPDLSPGATSWWRIVVSNSSASLASTPIQVSQPATAGLNGTPLTPTSLELVWNNPARYGGLLGFASYQVMRSVGGGAYTAVAVIPNASTTRFTATRLSPASAYSWYIVTTDSCVACGGLKESSPSNVVSGNVSAPLSAAVLFSPVNADANRSVLLSCVAAGGKAPYLYGWTFGDGSKGSGQTVAHLFAVGGPYLVTCTATDAMGARANGSAPVSISPALSVRANVDHSTAAPGTPLTFAAVSTGGPGTFSNYSWSFGDGATSSGSVATHAYAKPGQYGTSVSVTDGNRVTATDRVDVTVSVLAVTAAASTESPGVGESVLFSASARGGGGAPYQFVWAFGDGSSGSGPSVEHSYSSAGRYLVTVTVADALNGNVTRTVATIGVGSSGFSLLGVDAPWSYVVAGSIALAIGLSVWGIRRAARRRRSPPEPGGVDRELGRARPEVEAETSAPSRRSSAEDSEDRRPE